MRGQAPHSASFTMSLGALASPLPGLTATDPYRGETESPLLARFRRTQSHPALLSDPEPKGCFAPSHLHHLHHLQGSWRAQSCSCCAGQPGLEVAPQQGMGVGGDGGTAGGGGSASLQAAPKRPARADCVWRKLGALPSVYPPPVLP